MDVGGNREGGVGDHSDTCWVPKYSKLNVFLVVFAFAWVSLSELALVPSLAHDV